MIGVKFAENEIGVNIIQFPSEKFGFVGFKIPGSLLYIASDEELKKAKDAGITQFLKKRVFETKEEAAQALADWLEANPEFINTAAQ
jgi:hypothetical protein